MSVIQNKIYPLMPVFIQNIMISSYGYQWQRRRFGGLYESSVKEAGNREFYTREQWEKYQTEALRNLLVHSFLNVPFYNERFSHAGFKESDLRNISIAGLKDLPYLEKEDLRVFGTSALLSKNPSKGIFISSSGSTGTPTKIFIPQYFHQQWTALMEARVRNWAGVSRKTPRGMIGGRRVIPSAVGKPPYYRYNHFEKQTYFSAYHIRPETAMNYLEGMKRNGVEYMTGYAVSNYLLVKHFSDLMLNPPVLKAVITSSEKLTSEMRWTIEDIYHCKCFDSYSGCEACGLISETPEGILVVSPDAGIMEFLDEDGKNSAPGQSGEIVSTGLLNYDQPLIRYRIGDIAKLSTDQSSVNGRHMVRIDEIEGRIEDTVVTNDGRSMVRFHGLYLDITGLKTGQLVQNDYDRFTLNLVVDKFSYQKEKAESVLTARLESQVGKAYIKFRYPELIEPESSGKIRAVKSEVIKRVRN